MKTIFNGYGYILQDDLGRKLGSTTDKDKADKVQKATGQYALWPDMPQSLRLHLAMAGYCN